MTEPRPQPEPLWREALGARLRCLRHEQGATLTEAAARAGLSPQYLSEIERGIKEPSSEMVAAVAGALGVTLLDLTTAVVEDLRSGQERRHLRSVTAGVATATTVARTRAVGTRAATSMTAAATATGVTSTMATTVALSAKGIVVSLRGPVHGYLLAA